MSTPRKDPKDKKRPGPKALPADQRRVNAGAIRLRQVDMKRIDRLSKKIGRSEYMVQAVLEKMDRDEAAKRSLSA